MASLPAFKNYDEAEFDAWVEAHVAILREQQNADWRIDNERIIQGVLKRAGRIRERLVCGEAVLRPMPPDGRIPSWAAELEAYLHYPGSSDAGARSGNDSPTPRQEPRDFVVLPAPANEPEATPVEAKGDPGRPPLDEQAIRDQYAEILTLEARGVRGDKALANHLGRSETTVRRRRGRGKQLLGQ